MFKSKCFRCNEKINKNFDFCPSCGVSLKSHNFKEDYGILGKNDNINDIPFDDFGGFSIGRLLNNAFKEMPAIMKAFEKQIMDEMNNANKKNNSNSDFPKMNVRFMVNGKEVFPQVQEKNQAKKTKLFIDKEKIKKLSKLPKEEPLSRIRRLSGRIIYELAVPGVDDINDIIINRLENSIQIKAISPKKVYSKTLNINLPIIGYQLAKGNLILELQSNNS